MSGIFGIFNRDDQPVAASALETMRLAMADWGPDNSHVCLQGSVGLGQTLFLSTPEARYEHLPGIDKNDGLIFTAAARVDNRSELVTDCRLRREDLNHRSAIEDQLSVIADGDLILQAYRHWGEDCVNRIFGDWAFAVWHPIERKLFLARDHFGNTALYYYADPHVFAFASSRQALLALNLAPIELDELYLAQVLIGWTAYHGERTIHQPIRRLPPAHTITVTSQRLDVRQYWQLEDTPELHLPRRRDYVDAFSAVFDEAIRARMRSPFSRETQTEAGIAVTLSGGLDSGSVAASAAKFLRDVDRRLNAFTSVPVFDTHCYVGQNSGDELSLAQATARFAGNVDLQPITANHVSPIQAIHQMLHIHNEPCHAASNFYWMIEVRQAAHSQGCRVLLNGQLGNAGISWYGDVFSQPLIFQLRRLGWRKWSKEKIKRVLPQSIYATVQQWRMNQLDWYRNSAIRPDFAERLNLLERRLSDPSEMPVRIPLEQRRFIMPGRSFSGALHAQMGAAFGLEVRDPTADARVLAFTFSVPDHIFIDPETGQNRWLIREAMKGRLPDEVRLNRRFGQQAGDLVPRLRACADEVEVALKELAHGPAAAYVDVPYMRDVWRMIQTQDTPEAFHKAITILTRGIMAGLFVNGFQ